MKRTYAIADLHGRFDLLTAAYDRLRAFEDGGTIVHLGDYVDRGPQSRQIIEFLMDQNTVPSGFKRVVLKGNHEDMMVVCCADLAEIGWWIGNGGGRTLISYGQKVDQLADPKVIPFEHLEWMNDLPKFYADDFRVFVHAGLIRGLELVEQPDEALLWMLWPKGDVDGYRGLHIVHGHHQHEKGPIRFPGRTNLDVFAWATGRIVIGVFDDYNPGGPVEFIEIKAERDEDWDEDADD